MNKYFVSLYFRSCHLKNNIFLVFNFLKDYENSKKLHHKRSQCPKRNVHESYNAIIDVFSMYVLFIYLSICICF